MHKSMATRSRGRPRHDDLLTPAEWRVVEGLRHGMSARLIAQRRGISLDAVKFHIANACAKLQLGGTRELRRWDGIARHGALKGKRNNAMTEHALALGPIGQISRSVSNIEAAVAWYRDVLGLTHLFTAGPLAFFDCGGTRLFLSEGAVKPESILYFRVADIHAAHQTFVSRAVHVVSVPHMIHRHENGMEEWMAFFADPEVAVLAEAHSRVIAIMAQVMPDG